ncbi:MAG TPA: hypothetical protein VM432_08595, partial [Bdellovibrionales bacterium]|nr:hypothetical protein [Bdellovibrionales bacterium]
YHMTHKQRTSPPQPPSVDKFHAFKVSVGEEHRERILASSNWLPGTAASSSDTITFHLQDRDGYPFEVEIKFVSGDQRFKFRSLDFSLYDDAEGLLATKLVNDSFGEFEFKRDGSNLQLLRKNF